jgi:hypothetical protein
MTKEKNRYSRIIEAIFHKHYRKNSVEVVFERSEIINTAAKLRIKLPKNVGDVLYSFRYRQNLPKSIAGKAAAGLEWIVRPAGRARYRFVLSSKAFITPSNDLVETKILDATPGLISKYSFNDEQALLARLRYNRLVDIFTGLTCYSLQSHLRTTVPDMGQVETDEIYVGLDKRGVHYVLPVQAKGGKDKIGIVQIEQDIALCAAKFPTLVCRSLAAQFLDDAVIALFELEQSKEGIRISAEKHYRLVKPEDLSPEELEDYKKRSLA